VAFVVLCPVYQVDDVVDLVAGDRSEDLQIIIFLDIGRKPAQERRDCTLDAVHALELTGARARAA
jgi:hypothetical protein